MTSHGSPYPAGSPTATTATPTSETFPPHFLATSSRRTSPITKTYHQSSTLFLTRRLPEALTTLQPLITPRLADDGGLLEPAPIARASRSTRIKVWSLYLTILNAVVDMEPEEGKDAFGGQDWRALCNKVRDGDVWEEVVRNGYHGVEGDVDTDVVINLATLLLAHARNQILNQKRLESYLATCTTPNLDVTSRLGSDTPKASHRYMSPARGSVSGAATPRDLNARVKILELYTLHVLLRNNEWEYAREFISVSSVLDDERREAFLQALESLQEEQQEVQRREREDRERHQEELRREKAEARRLKEENERMERRRKELERQGGSEVDYGVEDAPIRGTPRDPNKSALSRSGRKAPAPPPTLGERATVFARRFHAALDQLSVALQTNPMFLMRAVAFVLGLVLVLSRQGVRERIRRIIAGSWGKVKATAGMGVKVSYI